ncbi:MAG: NAD+ synthase [Actinobacteria bacterium]|nr:NAD+ synthase [Actinomycetota bacterium]MCA1719614.1 NAD+ synthase [Actinomycetota bacterium]
MAQLRIGLAQVDAVVGDLPGNADLVSTWTAHALERGCHVVAFPEMVLTGYPAEDLVLRSSFVQASLAELERLAVRLEAEGAGDIAVVVGYCGRSEVPVPALGRPAGEPQNSAAVLHGGRVVARYAKHHLPNYGVFDEFRYFVRGDRFPVVRVHGVDVGITICEDLWQEGGPIAVAREAGVGLVLCINGSPYERGKDDLRGELVCRRAKQAGAALAYVNLVGGQDELVFDGDSLVADADGQVLARAPLWEEGLVVVDLDLPTATLRTTGAVDARDGTTMTVEHVVLSEDELPPYEPVVVGVAPRLEDEAEVWGALVTGTRDYARKNRFRSAVLGLSGGIDSAVVATIACDALGAGQVHVIGMPSRFSSDHSVSDAKELADRQGLQWQQVPITRMIDAWEQTLPLTGLAVENLQARVRGTTLMALSNEHGHLVLAPGNKSELATGFSTLYGDSVGGYAPIKDVPKSMVWRLARWRNALAESRGETPPIPENSIRKEPSAELAPGQLDRDRLPPYDELDALLDDYVEHDLGRTELIAKGHTETTVDRVISLVDAAEYKRRQYPPGPKITGRAFGRDRRLPITSRWREVAAPTAGEPAETRPETSPDPAP